LLTFVCVSTAAAKTPDGGNYGAINIGPSGILGYFKNGSPHFTVVHVDQGSPADGKVAKDDVIVSVNGRALDGFPVKGGSPKAWYAKKGSRYVLGSAVTEAEASDGLLRFAIERGATKLSIDVQIPVLGAYSTTWPVNCAKSDKIVRDIAEFLIGIQNDEGKFVWPQVELPKGLSGYGRNAIGDTMAGLFLLSTGEEKDLAAAKKFAGTLGGGGGTSTWYLGYRGLFLGEYYLRTGDPTARKKLAEICTALAAHDKVGSWGHHIDRVSPGYVRGGLMNAAAINCFKAYLLARECGIKLDEAAFLRTLHFFYEFAGKGSTPYGDHRPRVNGNANGKGPSTACAYILMDDPRATRAAQLLAVTAVDTFAGFEGGHTGNGFNIMWRGIAAVHVPGEFDDRRQRCMNGLAWYYDLARGRDGSVRFMPVPQGDHRYASIAWGTGSMGLHYTAHRKTLRITGKPRGTFNANPKLPPDKYWRWYEQPDNDHFKVGFCEGGRDLRPGIVEYDQMTTPTVEECEILMRHYDGYVRKSFAMRLSQVTGDDGAIDPKALDAIERALKHPDERVQRAATDALSGQHPWFAMARTASLVTPETIGKRFAPYLVKILKDDRADIWLKDGALWAFARADGETIMKHNDVVANYDTHRIWWLRQSARARVYGLSKSQMVDLDTVKMMLAAKGTEGRAFPNVALTTDTAMAMAGSKLSDEEQAYIIQNMVKDRMKGGPPPDRRDDYGYPPPKARVPGRADGFYPLIQGVPPKQYAATFPLLIAAIDRWGDPGDREPVTASIGMTFYGVKRFRGIMGVLMQLGRESQPVMLRLKQFLYSDEVAAARAKFLPNKNVGVKAKVFDPVVERLKKSVGTWEEKFGKLAVDPVSRAGKTYRPCRPIVESELTPSQLAEAAQGGAAPTPATPKPELQTKSVPLTGKMLVEESLSQRKDKTTTVIEYALKTDDETYKLPYASLCMLPVSLRDLHGATVTMACKMTEKHDRKKKKTTVRVHEIDSLKVLRERQ